MKERPILFSAPMVRAILSGQKTQTRRALRVQPLDVLPMNGDAAGREWVGLMTRDPEPKGTVFHCKYGAPGDRLWMRETWNIGLDHNRVEIHHAADKSVRRFDREQLTGQQDNDAARWAAKHSEWHPSIHMPRWASRITLEITGVRVEHLNEISDVDALKEGAPDHVNNGGTRSAPASFWFQWLWNEINGADSWDSNPWVWVIEFRRVVD